VIPPFCEQASASSSAQHVAAMLDGAAWRRKPEDEETKLVRFARAHAILFHGVVQGCRGEDKVCAREAHVW